jgi:hypothetical protein
MLPPPPRPTPPPGNNNHDRYRRWAALPVLLGLSLGSMAPTPSLQDRVGRALDNDLHALGTAMQSLALAHQVGVEGGSRVGGFGSGSGWRCGWHNPSQA